MDLRVTAFSWTKKWWPGIYDFAAEIKIGGTIYQGRGASSSPEIALEKAIAESFERLICHFHNISSFGVAVHSNLEDAKENAKNEFYERSSIDLHSNMNIPVAKYSSLSFCKSTFDILENAGFKTSVFELSSPFNKRTVSLFTDNGVISFSGHACSNSLESAVKKSLIEIMRNVSAYTDGKKIEPQTHLLDPKISYFESSYSNIKNSRLNMNSIIYGMELQKPELLNSAPIHCFKYNLKDQKFD